MSSNISGFQGVKTPLQSMTNGRYTLADYTQMNTVLSARITALEKAVAFNPNNVTVGGYLNIQSNSSNPGNLAVTNNAQISGSLQVNKTATVTQNLNVGGNLTVTGNINFVSSTINTLNSTTINNSGVLTSGTFVGDGAALTNVLDATKLPLAGGSLSGALIVNGNITANGGYILSGNGSGLTNLNDITKLPLAGGSISGNLAVLGTITGNGAGLTTIPYSALSGVVPTWNQSTTGNALTATTVTNLSGGTAGKIPYQSGASTTLFSAVGTVGQVLTSQGTSAPTWTTSSTTDPTKMPLAGGSFTGAVVGTGWNAHYSYDQILNQTYTPPVNNTSMWDQVEFNYSANCNLSMINISANNNGSYTDDTRKITITKRGMPAGDFVVTLMLPPAGYTFQNSTSSGATTTTIPLGVYSHTYLVKSDYFGNPGFMLISQV